MANFVRIEIDVDLSGLEGMEKRLTEVKRQLQATVKEMGDATRDKWIANAEESLKSSARYSQAVMNGVSYPDEGDPSSYMCKPNFRSVATTHNDKDLGILLEYGFEPFDMKVKVLKGGTKKIMRFEFGKPGSGSSVELEKSVYNLAKNHNLFQNYPLDKKHFPSIFGKSVKPNIMNERRVKDFSPIINNNDVSRFGKPLQDRYNNSGTPKNLQIQYQWQKGRYEGMKATKGSGGKTFSIFRTISPKSKPDSWIHPGMRPKLIFKNTMDIMKPQIYAAFQKVVDRMYK